MKRLVFTVAVLSVFAGACRKDPPPPISPHVLNGVGVGVYCKKVDDQGKCIESVKKLPSEMKGWVSFEPNELKAYVTWCYNPEDN